MADLRALVSELAKIGEGPPVITLYLDTHWRDEQQRNRVRLFFRDRAREAKQLFGESADAEGIIATLDQLNEWVDAAVNQESSPEARGVLLVASKPRNLFVECLLAESIEPAMFIDAKPRLFPIIELLRFEHPAFLVAVDSAGAEILEWKAGEIVDEQDVERDIPNRHKRGGWSQRHYSQHIRRLIQGVWKECASVLERLAVDQPNADIVLFGQEPNVRGFEKLLPEALLNRIIGMKPWPADRRKLLEMAREVISEERVARDFAVVHRILRQGLSDRSGTVGLAETLLAMNEQRVKMLTLSNRFDMSGYRCTVCNALSMHGITCGFCGGRMDMVSLREELSRRCVAEGGDVYVIPDGGPLEAYEGIGALLRHLTGEERAQHPLGRLSPPETSLSTS